jgi:fluoride exporter
MLFLCIGLGGFLGALARYSVGLAFPFEGNFPWATLIVNVLGCFLIGLAAPYKNLFPETFFLFFVPGFLGAFTTFSAFGLETIRLMQNQQWPLALMNVASNLVLGLGAIGLVFYFLARTNPS